MQVLFLRRGGIVFAHKLDAFIFGLGLGLDLLLDWLGLDGFGRDGDELLVYILKEMKFFCI